MILDRPVSSHVCFMLSFECMREGLAVVASHNVTNIYNMLRASVTSSSKIYVCGRLCVTVCVNECVCACSL